MAETKETSESNLFLNLYQLEENKIWEYKLNKCIETLSELLEFRKCQQLTPEEILKIKKEFETEELITIEKTKIQIHFITRQNEIKDVKKIKESIYLAI